MTCQDVVLQFLMDYLARELSPELEVEFDRHLAACPSCVNYLESYRRTVALGREATDEVDEASIPEELVQAILSLKGP